MPLLAPQTRVLCPDLRGLGWTEVPGRGYDRETMDRDVLALLGELARLALRAGFDAFSEGRDRSLHRSPEGRAGPRSELLYRTFLLREAVPVFAGRYAGVPFEVPTLLLVGARDAVTRLLSSLSAGHMR
jgi:hypothetical protein